MILRDPAAIKEKPSTVPLMASLSFLSLPLPAWKGHKKERKQKASKSFVLFYTTMRSLQHLLLFTLFLVLCLSSVSFGEEGAKEKEERVCDQHGNCKRTNRKQVAIIGGGIAGRYV